MNGIKIIRTQKNKRLGHPKDARDASGQQRTEIMGSTSLLIHWIRTFLRCADQKWAGDISYIWTREGWRYLTVTLEFYSLRVIGWADCNRMKRDLASRALNMAVALRQPPKARMSKHGFKVSTDSKGNCYDCDYVAAV